SDKLSGLGLSDNTDAIGTLYYFSVLLTGILVFPTIRNDFQNRFILLFFTISDCREKKLESEAIKYGVYLQTYLLQNVL
ncbi:hypothetical protein ACUOA5_42475, partial [Escherichia coli]